MNVRRAAIPIVKQEISRAKVLPLCHICKQVPLNGLRDGIKLKRAFICRQCEQEIANIDVGSTNYQIMLEKIKDILK